MEKEKKGTPHKDMCVGRSLQVWEAVENLVLGVLGEKQREPDQEGPCRPF